MILPKFYWCTLSGQMSKVVKYGCFLNIKGGWYPGLLKSLLLTSYYLGIQSKNDHWVMNTFHAFSRGTKNFNFLVALDEWIWPDRRRILFIPIPHSSMGLYRNAIWCFPLMIPGLITFWPHAPSSYEIRKRWTSI